MRRTRRRTGSPPAGGWSALTAVDPFTHDGSFPIPAYSEQMAGPFVGRKPARTDDPTTRPPGDEHGWRVPIYQEAQQLAPGLAHVARVVAAKLRRLQRGDRPFSRDLLDGNPYAPPELLDAGPALLHRPLVGILSLSLSRTQDDKGRVRWTLFGASEHGPAAAFWRSFRAAPDEEDAPARGAKRLLGAIELLAPGVATLARAGVRVLPAGGDPAWGDEPIPSFLDRHLIDDRASLRGVRVIVTFRPFARLPASIRRAYLRGDLELCPSPASLIFFGHPGYARLARELPFAAQIPLLRAIPGQHVALSGLRVPQSGWLDEEKQPRRRPATHGAIVDRIKRTHRWNRSRRDRDERERIELTDRVSDALFSTDPKVVGLYDKPMARNAQIWTEDYRLLLDGPRATRFRIDEAARAIDAGGRFGYRFHWQPMRVGRHEVFWQRPVLFADRSGAGDPDRVDVDGFRGWLVACDPGAAPDAAARPVAHFWPRPDDRAAHSDNLRAFPGGERHEARYDVRKLLEARELLGAKLERSFAARLVGAKLPSIDAWLEGLPSRAADPAAAKRLASAIARALAPSDPGPSITFAQAATRGFETRYWETIATLADGSWNTKNNADPVTAGDRGGGGGRPPDRDLDRLARWLAGVHQAAIDRHGMTGRAVVGEHRFRWTTDFDFAWMRGWGRSQTEGPSERNVVCVIPGRDRTRAAILADHYDTAYMEDVYEGRVRGVAGSGAGSRRAAAGADDNHSATAALLTAADVLLPLAREGRLAHDVWLVHLTGEEFPGDCLGARHLAQRLVEGNLALDPAAGGRIDLSGVRIAGAIVMDMIAHNLERDPYVFQIAPGEGAEAMRLALLAHRANERWNRDAAGWNAAPARRDAAPYRRVTGASPPAIAPHPIMHGEIRPHWHWSSTVFNTDAQIFSDAGIPVVLLMEHYDIDRKGYHDTHDTLENIDLDFGAAVAAIAIETIAELAVSSSR
jgi:hypothetical protein